MALELTVIPLEGERLAKALPLIQIVRPDLTLDKLRALLDAPSIDHAGAPSSEGIVALENEHSCIVGVFSYAIVNEPLDGRMLLVNHVVIMDMFGRYQPQCAMMAEMEALAGRHGCDMLQVNLIDTRALFPQEVGPLVRCFQSAGHSFDGLRLRKRLPGTLAR